MRKRHRYFVSFSFNTQKQGILTSDVTVKSYKRIKTGKHIQQLHDDLISIVKDHCPDADYIFINSITKL